MTQPEDPYRRPAGDPIPFPAPGIAPQQYPGGQPGQPYPGQPYPGQQLGQPTSGQGYPGQQPYPTNPAGAGGFVSPNDPEFGSPYRGYNLTERPRKVTVAAVLAFISAGLTILLGAVVLTANEVNGVDSTLKALAFATFAVCVLYIWGGVTALAGKNGKILVIGAALSIVLSLAVILYTTTQGLAIELRDFYSLILPAIIITRLLHEQPRAWFKAKGGTTF